jgi:hypothetical protein
MMPTNPDTELMRIFDFTVADLEANRAGRITQSQSERLLKYVALFPSLLFHLVYLVVIIVIFRNAGTALFLVIPFELIVYIVLIAVAIHKRQIIKSDVESEIAISVDGGIRLQSGVTAETCLSQIKH